MTEKCWQFA